jgi:hypothetical protein
LLIVGASNRWKQFAELSNKPDAAAVSSISSKILRLGGEAGLPGSAASARG